MNNSDYFTPRSESDQAVYDQRMENYMKLSAPISAAEFWWTHLTHAQQKFIIAKFEQSEVHPDDITYQEMIEQAYKISSAYHVMEGWPVDTSVAFCKELQK